MALFLRKSSNRLKKMFRRLKDTIFSAYFKIARAVFPVNIYLFNSPYGYHDNAKYLLEYFEKQNALVYWVVSPMARIGPRRNVMANSLFLKILLPRVKVCFITHGLGDVCRRLPREVIVVNSWHGIPLKKMGYDSSMDRHRFNLNEGENPYKKNNFLIAASEISRPHMQSCMGLSENEVLPLGQPRTDVLYHKGMDSDFCDSIRADLYGNSKAVFLYAPTFRDSGDAEVIYQCVIESFVNYANLDDLLVLRLHAEDQSNASRLIEKKKNIVLSKAIDPIDDLLVADVLISDYSSIVFDYMLLGRPIFLFVPDYINYVSNRGGLYFDFKDVMRGAIILDDQVDREVWQSYLGFKDVFYPAAKLMHIKDSSASLYERFF